MVKLSGLPYLRQMPHGGAVAQHGGVIDISRRLNPRRAQELYRFRRCDSWGDPPRTHSGPGFRGCHIHIHIHAVAGRIVHEEQAAGSLIHGQYVNGVSGAGVNAL
jgi:hypothetical protein